MKNPRMFKRSTLIIRIAIIVLLGAVGLGLIAGCQSKPTLDKGEVTILHGSDDEVIPIAMGRTPASRHSDTVRLIEIPGGRHNTVQEQHAEILSRALLETGNE